MSKEMNERLNDAIKPFNVAAADITKGNHVVVTLESPQMLTVLRNGGKASYAKQAFLGDETFVFERVYYGKKNTPIVVFKPKVASTEFVSVEIPAANLKCTDFADWYDSIWQQDGHMTIEDMWRSLHESAMTTVKEKQVAEGVNAYGASWGYWG